MTTFQPFSEPQSVGLKGLDSIRPPRPDMYQPLSRTAPSELCPHCRRGPCIHDVSPTGLKTPLRQKLNLNSLWTWSSHNLSHARFIIGVKKPKPRESKKSELEPVCSHSRSVHFELTTDLPSRRDSHRRIQNN